jgi:hypothetical protein
LDRYEYQSEEGCGYRCLFSHDFDFLLGIFTIFYRENRTNRISPGTRVFGALRMYGITSYPTGPEWLEKWSEPFYDAP